MRFLVTASVPIGSRYQQRTISLALCRKKRAPIQNLLKFSKYLLSVLTLITNAYPAAGQSSSSQHMLTDTLIPYAPVKRPATPIEHRDALNYSPPEPLPIVGIAIVGGSFGNVDWTIVNLDTRKLSDIQTQLASQQDEKNGLNVHRTERSLTVVEANEIIRQANMVWNPVNPRSPPPFGTDASCDVVLLDHDDVLVDHGTMCPDAQLVNLINTIEAPGLKLP